MKLTFISARFGAPERHAVVAVTEECGSMVISPADTPQEWIALWESGIIIEPYVFREAGTND